VPWRIFGFSPRCAVTRSIGCLSAVSAGSDKTAKWMPPFRPALDVPVNKTMTAFTKPVDAIVGEAFAEAGARGSRPDAAISTKALRR
jgi:hypothetical protein